MLFFILSKNQRREEKRREKEREEREQKEKEDELIRDRGEK
jgi:hypothetical protein